MAEALHNRGSMKTATIFMLGGALLGIAIASLIVPPALAWYSSPGGLPQGAQIQAIVQISEVIRYTTSKLIQWQLVGAAIGAAAGLTAGVLYNNKKAKPKSGAPLPAVKPPTAT
jgi:hypothetical protein